MIGGGFSGRTAKMSSFFGFSGRIGRGTYWLSQLIVVLIVSLVIAAAFVLAKDNRTSGNDNTGSFLSILIIGILLNIAINVSVIVKRYHDRGKSGFWFWIVLLPFGGIWQFIELGFVPGDEGDNHYGPPPGSASKRDIKEAKPSQQFAKLDDAYFADYARNLANQIATAGDPAQAQTSNTPTATPTFGKR